MKHIAFPYYDDEGCVPDDTPEGKLIWMMKDKSHLLTTSI